MSSKLQEKWNKAEHRANLAIKSTCFIWQSVENTRERNSSLWREVLVILLHEFQQCYQLVVHFLKAHRKRETVMCSGSSNVLTFHRIEIKVKVHEIPRGEGLFKVQGVHQQLGEEVLVGWKDQACGEVSYKGKISGTLANLKYDCRDLCILSSILCDHQS